MGKADAGAKGALTGSWTAGAYTVVIWVAVYLICTVGARTREMVYERGMIPHLIILASAFALGFLVYRYVGVKVSERNVSALANFAQSHSKQILLFHQTEPQDPSITHAATNLFHTVPDGMEKERILTLLKDCKEVGTEFAMKRLEMFLTLEAQASENAYKIPHVLAWVVPMLGFLGTVWGISLSLGNFTGVMGNVNNINQIKQGLGTITAGLGIAFDTTLLGLVFAIMITGAGAFVHRREGACLDKLERIGLDILQMVSSQEGRNTQDREERARVRTIEALHSAAQSIEALAAQFSNPKMLVKPSEDLKESLHTFQAHVKHFTRIAQASDHLAEHRNALEAAAHAIRELRDFSDSLQNFSQASRDLMLAVSILRERREFRLVEMLAGDGDGHRRHGDRR